MKGEPLKTYNLKFYTEQDLVIFESFQNQVIRDNETVVGQLIYLCDKYVSESNTECELVTESKLIEQAKEKGFTSSRSSLKKYRILKLLKEGEDWWTNPDGNIVYNLQSSLTLLENRSKNPYSKLPIKEEQNGKKEE